MADVPFAERYTPDILRSNHEGALSSAREVVPLLLAAMPALESVVDVGTGVGTWLAEFMRRGIWDVLGMDGPWVRPAQLVIPASHFAAIDLREPMRSMLGFNLCLCLEVAEHLSSEHADTIVASVTSLAPIVFFSAAIPGQGGWHHENEQPIAYWHKKFAARGYMPRVLPGLAESGPEVCDYYKRAVLYIREGES